LPLKYCARRIFRNGSRYWRQSEGVFDMGQKAGPRARHLQLLVFDIFGPCELGSRGAFFLLSHAHRETRLGLVPPGLGSLRLLSGDFRRRRLLRVRRRKCPRVSLPPPPRRLYKLLPPSFVFLSSISRPCSLPSLPQSR